MKTLALFAILLLNAVASPAAPPPLPATPLWSVTIPFTTNGTVDSSSPGGDLLTDGKGGLALVLEQDKSNAVVNHRIIWIKASGRLVLDELFDNSEDIEIILVTPKRLVAVIGNSRNLMRTYYYSGSQLTFKDTTITQGTHLTPQITPDNVGYFGFKYADPNTNGVLSRIDRFAF